VRALENFLFFSLLLAYISAFFSITAYEAFLVLAIISGVILLAVKRINPLKGLFSIPLIGHLSTITLSSILFLRVKEQWRRLLEQDFFSLSYFSVFALDREKVLRLVEFFLKLAPLLGLIVSIKVLYTYCTTNDVKAFWGGNFVIGNLLALPFFASLYWFFKTERKLLKLTLLLLATIFLYTSLLPVERSVILGFLLGISIFIIPLIRFSKLSIKWITLIIFVTLSGISIATYQHPKVKYWIYLLKNHSNIEETVNRISSGRVVIAKGALELIENATQNGDYTKLLIGWGYGPQKQYNNLPRYFHFMNEYESFVFLTEFINGGILNIFFLLWFYIALIYLTLKVLRKRDNLYMEKIVLVSTVWVNMGYHLFTLFWVPINALFYIFLALVERLNRLK